LIYSNVWIASGAISLSFIFYIIFNLPFDYTLSCFVFSTTLFIYNWQRFAKIKSDQPFTGQRLEWMQRNKVSVLFLLVFSGCSGIFLLLFLQLDILKILIPFSVVAFLYVGKFPFKKLINLRDVPLVKAHLVAGIWAGMAVLLPAFQANVELDNEIWILFSSIYFFILSLAIIFDIRDIEMDEPSKKTIPQLIGIKPASFVAMGFNLLAVGLLIYLFNELFFTLIIFSILSAFFYFFATKKRGDFYFSFWIDGLIILFTTVTILTILYE